MEMSKDQAATIINAAITKAQELQRKSAKEHTEELISNADSAIDLHAKVQETTMLLGFSKALLLLADVNETFKQLVETGLALDTPDEALEFVSDLNDNELLEVLLPISLYLLPSDEIDDILEK